MNTILTHDEGLERQSLLKTLNCHTNKESTLLLSKTYTRSNQQNITIGIKSRQYHFIDKNHNITIITLRDNSNGVLWDNSFVANDTVTPQAIFESIASLFTRIDESGLPQEALDDVVCDDLSYIIPLGLTSLEIRSFSIDQIEFLPPNVQDDPVTLYLDNKSPEAILRDILYCLRHNIDHKHKIDDDDLFVSEFLASRYGHYAQKIIRNLLKDNQKNRSENALYWDYLAVLRRFSNQNAS